MRQAVWFRVISTRKHVKGQPLNGCLTLHNGIWKTNKRKINMQIKIGQKVKLNDKCNKNKRLIPVFWIFEIRKISKHLRLHFFQMSGCITVFVIHYNIHCINDFLPYYAYANSEESGKSHVIQYLHSLWLHSTHLASVKISGKIHFKGHPSRWPSKTACWVRPESHELIHLWVDPLIP